MGIVGAGSIGSGVAFSAVKAGISVILVEAIKENLEKGAESIKRSVRKMVEAKEVLENEVETIFGRVQMGFDLAALGKVDFAIESITEDEKLKSNMVRELDNILKPQAILASHSALVSITKLAKSTTRPQQVVGMHFFKPVEKTKFVEIVRGVQSSEQVLRSTLDLAKRLNFEAIVVHDFPGMVTHRILATMMNEAIYALYEGLASAVDIDKALRLTSEQPTGPLAQADRMGLDVLYSYLKSLHQEFGNPKYAPCPLLVKYVEAGYLGRKTGKGFYEY